MSDGNISFQHKLYAIKRIVMYRPGLAALITIAGTLAAFLDVIGLSFLLPIVEIAQSQGGTSTDTGGTVGVFIIVYQTIGIPFTLEYVILGVATALTARYGMSFLVGWFRAKLQMEYTRNLRERALNGALDAGVSYYDKEGSDDILNGIITQTAYAGKAIEQLVRVFELGVLCAVYALVTLYVSAKMSVLAALILGGITFIFRYVIEPGYSIGDRVASANERVQETAQAATQGIRDVKLFGLSEWLQEQFYVAVQNHETASVQRIRNNVAMDKFYNLASAVTVFVLIYFGLELLSLSIGALSVFLFAMFLLAPRLSNLNSRIYGLETDLPHIIRTEEFITELESYSEKGQGHKQVPSRIKTVEFQEVDFSYQTGEKVLKNISFKINRGDFVAFVGQSGAGKSTIVSLLARLYEIDSGTILANGQPISDFNLRQWREQLAVVRQNPHIFNDTLRFNLTIGNQDISQAELKRVCEISQITEFVEDLPNEYNTQLGDDGVKLSGGQRQRVALARALLKDAEILILDEATSDLDSNLEKKVHRAIEEMDRNHTIIGIAHRLSTVRNADTIYTLQDGYITEQGRHEELLENNGKYAQLYATQAKG